MWESLMTHSHLPKNRNVADGEKKNVRRQMEIRGRNVSFTITSFLTEKGMSPSVVSLIDEWI